jgi:hypothetical protein
LRWIFYLRNHKYSPGIFQSTKFYITWSFCIFILWKETLEWWSSIPPISTKRTITSHLNYELVKYVAKLPTKKWTEQYRFNRFIRHIFVPVLNQDMDFQRQSPWSFCVQWDQLRWEVIVRFVDIGGIDDHHSKVSFHKMKMQNDHVIVLV